MAASDSSSSDFDSDDEIPVFSLGSKAVTQTVKPNSSSLMKNLNLPATITNKNLKLSSALDPGIDIPDTYLNTFPHRYVEEGNKKIKSLFVRHAMDELSKKSAICQPGFEKQHTVPPYLQGKRKIRKERIKERDKTAGSSWFDLPATEMTEERKNDMMVLQMRKALDPKHFYKRGAMKTLPKYFQVGTIIEPPIDFYHARVPKRQRKQTLVDELLADAEFKKYQKKKYTEAIMSQPQKMHFSQKKKKTKLLEARHSKPKVKQNKKQR